MASVRFSPASISAPSSGSTYSVEVTYVGCSINISETNAANSHLANLDWVDVTIRSSTSVEVNIQSNYAESRSTNFRIVADAAGGYVFGDLSISQEGLNLIVLTGSLDVPGKAGSSTVVLSSAWGNQRGWTAVSSQNWVKCSISDAGNNTANLKFTYDDNPSLEEDRTSSITITHYLQNNPYQVSKTYTLTQAARPDDEITFQFTPNTSSLPFYANSHSSPALETHNVSSPGISSTSGDLGGTVTFTNNRLVFSVSANPGTTTLYKTVTMSGTSTVDGSVVYTTYTLYQAGFSIAPIWKDNVNEVSADDFVDYEIYVGNFLAYKGRAYKYPGDEKVGINVPRTVEDYLDNDFEWSAGLQRSDGWNRTFDLYVSGILVASYMLFNSWTYSDYINTINGVGVLNEPIINEIPAGAYVPICVFNTTSSSKSVDIFAGVTKRTTLSLSDNRQNRYLLPAVEGIAYSITSNNEAASIYKGVPDCKYDFVLYYSNALGGIDALPISGKFTKTDKITTQSYKKMAMRNSNDFGLQDYSKKIVPEWELNTGWLSDVQSGKMHNLIESTRVYLYDCSDKSIRPVVMTDNSMTWKTSRNQTKKHYNYTIKVKASQENIRK